ncbi:MAG TPA: ABC transporter substrate-binding protein [Candidatus Limnocylindrales bacterium]|nr:ABC transporter substrate-binding protein [Candidatus Limnocylindrales bacterium]
MRIGKKQYGILVVLLLLIPFPALAGPPLKIGVSDWPGWVAWYVAQEKGFFKKYGVDVELVWFPVYSDSISALSAAKLDANSQTWNDTMAPIAQGVDLKIILVNDNSAGNDAVVARPTIGSLKELKGKTVALEQFTVSHLLLLYALSQNGINPNGVHLVNMTVGDAAAAFLAGKVDAATLWNPWIIKVQQSGKGKVLFTSQEAPGLIPDCLVVRTSVLKERREDFIKVVRAWGDTVDFINQDPAKASEIMAPKVDMKPGDYTPFLKGTRFFNLQDNLEAFTVSSSMKSLYTSGAFIQDFLLKHKLLPKPFEIQQALDDSLIKEVTQK